MTEKNKKIAVYFLLFLIVAFGFFLRIYHINTAPPGIYPDEAVNGSDALQANDSGNYQWFYPANQGREGLFMNLIAFLFKFFGVSILNLKLPSIIFGTLTILGTYLLTKEMFKKERVALISAFFVATSFWAINFNRISFRANMLPFVLVFGFYFLFRGIRTKKYLDFIIGGFIFGIGMHTYIAWRIAPFILILGIIPFIWSYDNFLKEYWKKFLVFIIFAAIAAFPMFYTFYAHPEYFESRSDSISILSQSVNQGNLVGTFFKSLGLSLIKYNFVGDQNWRHNFPPYPILDYLTGTAFLFGIIYVFVRIFQLLKERFSAKIKNPKLAIYFFLVLWFFIMLAPEFMTAESLPHALRSIGTLPVVLIFSALTIEYLLSKLDWNRSAFAKELIILVYVIILASGAFNAIKYHIVWANKVETARAFESNVTDIIDYTSKLPKDQEIFAPLGNMQRVPVRIFNWYNPNFHDMSPNEILNIAPKTNNFIVVFSDFEKDYIIYNLKLKYPDLQFQEVKDKFGQNFYILK